MVYFLLTYRELERFVPLWREKSIPLPVARRGSIERTALFVLYPPSRDRRLQGGGAFEGYLGGAGFVDVAVFGPFYFEVSA